MGLTPAHRRGPATWSLSVAAFAVLALALWPTLVHGNGAAVAIVKNRQVGPYEIEVGILPGAPKVGNLHLSILVRDRDSGNSITDAQVQTAVVGPEGATDYGPALALNTRTTPQFYEVDIPLDAVGTWTLTLDLDGGLGRESVSLPIEVTEGSGFSLAFIAALGIAFLALAVWLTGLVRKKGRRKQGRAGR